MVTVAELKKEVLRIRKGDKPTSKLTKHELLSFLEKHNPSYLEKPAAEDAKPTKKPVKKLPVMEEVSEEEEVVVKPTKKAAKKVVEEVVEKKAAPKKAFPFKKKVAKEEVVEVEEKPVKKAAKKPAKKVVEEDVYY